MDTFVVGVLFWGAVIGGIILYAKLTENAFRDRIRK
jgi:hypothetical protein